MTGGYVRIRDSIGSLSITIPGIFVEGLSSLSMDLIALRSVITTFHF